MPLNVWIDLFFSQKVARIEFLSKFFLEKFAEWVSAYTHSKALLYVFKMRFILWTLLRYHVLKAVIPL